MDELQEELSNKNNELEVFNSEDKSLELNLRLYQLETRMKDLLEQD